MDNVWFVASLWVGLALVATLGFNRTEFGKAILAACFVNDLGTVIALGRARRRRLSVRGTDWIVTR